MRRNTSHFEGLRVAAIARTVVLTISLVVGTEAGTAQIRAEPSQAGFDQHVGVFVQQNCAICHNDRLKTGGLVLTKYHDTAAMLRDRLVWEKVVARVRAGEMPPKGLPRLKPEQIAATTNWIEAQFDALDARSKPDPGHLTAHRLNRAEYNNTVRDLLAVKFKPAVDFPADDSGYGFDNIGDVLSVSPVLMEKYLAAAKKIASEAIPSGGVPKPTLIRYSPEHQPSERRLTLEHTFDLPAEGDYDLHAGISGRKDEAFRIEMQLDGKPIQASDIVIDEDKPRSYETHLHVVYGEHVLRAVLIPREATEAEVVIAQKIRSSDETELQESLTAHPENAAEIKRQHALSHPAAYVDAIDIRGPFHALPPPVPESYKRVFICDHGPGQHNAQCARADLSHLARLAYRRPVTEAELDKLLRLVSLAQHDGLAFEPSMRVGIEAILVSPSFLYRLERDPNPGDPEAIHPVSDVELASRLSYFLWSSMPDDELLCLAEQHRLHYPDILHAQLRRMLQDKKSEALVDNFGGQWLELRNLDSVHPDPDEFPQFDEQLRQAMYTETRMFFQSVVQEDRSILDFLNGKYTFMNERLAKFYGISGVTGDEFRRVDLDGTQRSGVLTQASVLLITSYPTRTSPVLRGKWILENVLNTPPPPPPPGVGSIDAQGGVVTGTMRQQMEKHRANPTCAACHNRMDPLGFALENYNAIGEWRTQDGKLPVDASGVLPNGATFNGSAELKKILASNRNAFADCLTEKLLTYALGRGLDGYDRPAIRKIVSTLEANDYRFSSLITGIVDSTPFQMGRGDGGNIK